VAIFLLSDRARDITGQIVRIERTQLALVAHPVVLDPVLERDQWTLEALREALDQTCRDRLVPLGMTPLLRAEYLSRSSGMGGPASSQARNGSVVDCGKHQRLEIHGDGQVLLGVGDLHHENGQQVL